MFQANGFVVTMQGMPNRYTEQVARFIGQEFPGPDTRRSTDVDAMVEELIGTRQMRIGPVPSTGSCSAIKSVVARYMDRGLPIPILIPAAPKKPVCDQGVDFSEIAALRTLGCLHQRISSYYAPGVQYVLRMEDITGYFLEAGVSRLRESMDLYLGQFDALCSLFGYTGFMRTIRESSLVSEEKFFSTASPLIPIFEEFIDASDYAARTHTEAPIPSGLVERGWKGSLPVEQTEFYRARYRCMYPDLDERGVNGVLARYLANILTHRILGMSGADPSWDGHIQLSFVPPVPGTPPSLVSTRVYYRTIPLNRCKRNVPFWRARAYFRISDEEVCPTLANWTEPLSLSEAFATITNGITSVTIPTPFSVN